MLIGAIDQGTTSTRFFLYDDQGHAVASHQVEFEQIKPKAGYEGILQLHFCVHLCICTQQAAVVCDASPPTHTSYIPLH